MAPTDYSTERVRRILIIEDDDIIADIYKKKFELAGFAVEVEMDGSDGYYHISKTPPDAVLLDLLLPGMDGPKIIRKFRAQPKFSDLPIIVFTNAYLTGIGRDAVAAGATRVFNKATVAPHEIVDAVVNSLNRSIELPNPPAPVQVETTEHEETLNILEEPSFHSEPPLGRSVASPPPVPVAKELAQGGEAVEKAIAAAANPGGGSPDAPSQTLEPPRKAGSTQNDALQHEGVLQGLVRTEFLEKSGARISDMRQVLRALQVEGPHSPKGEALIALSQIAHKLSANSAIIGLNYLAHIAAAVEALAWELLDNPSQVSVSTRQTLAKAIDMIARLVACGSLGHLKEFSQFTVLVVDDDGVARQVITKTLDRVKLSHIAIGRPELAMQLLAENVFDLIILDVKMARMSGFEFCTALRRMARHRDCHVIFVSGLTDLQSKVTSTQVGGNDFIVKPFAPMELALKALLHMVTAQLDQENIESGQPAVGSP